MKKNLVFFCCVFLVLGGCATVDRFPTKSDDYSAIKEVDIILDLTVISDIRGSKLGIDIQKHKLLTKEIKQLLAQRFAEKNIKANFIYAGSGIFFEKAEDLKYFFADNFKDTDIPFDRYEHVVSFHDEKVLKFLKKVDSEGILFAPKLEEGAQKVNPLFFTDIPDVIRELPSERLGVFKVSVFLVSKLKSFAWGAATGAISLAASGGTILAINTGVSATHANFTLIDTNTGRLLWQNSQTERGARIVPLITANSAASFLGKAIKKSPNRIRNGKRKRKIKRRNQ